MKRWRNGGQTRSTQNGIDLYALREPTDPYANNNNNNNNNIRINVICQWLLVKKDQIVDLINYLCNKHSCHLVYCKGESLNVFNTKTVLIFFNLQIMRFNNFKGYVSRSTSHIISLIIKIIILLQKKFFKTKYQIHIN